MRIKDTNSNFNLKVKIVIDSEFNGFNSGWPTRYIGLITELYKYHLLSIFAPGDTSLLFKMFPNASVCNKTNSPIQKKNDSHYNLLKELISPSRYAPLKSDPPYSIKFHKIILEDSNRYDISIYFGINSFVFYGKEDKTPRIFCDFCDSYLRHKYNNIKMNRINGIKNYLSFHFDILYMKRFKKKFFPSDIIILAITDIDCEYISSVLRKNKVYTVPNGITMPNIVNNKNFVKKKYWSPYLLFVGSLDYEPNIDSILFSLDNLWSEIHDKFPEVIFRIVGRSPAKKLMQAAANIEGIELIGLVERVDEYYINSKCFLGPIFSGGGMKNKFLESLSAGTPVITTPEGAIGINMRTGQHGKIGSTKSELIEATFEMLSCSESEYSRYVNASISLAKENSWEKVGASFNNIILNVSY